MNVIEVKNLNKSYGHLKVLDNLSLEVKEGEILGFLGPNGTGKTTAISAMIGSIAYESGAITFFGKPLAKLTPEERHSIGIVPQEIAIFTELSVYDNIYYFARLNGMAKEEAKKITEALSSFEGIIDINFDHSKIKLGVNKDTQVEGIISLLNKNNISYTNFQTEAKNLQHIFIQLTGNRLRD